ncbi:Sialoadhesin [Merluccius polli]|uniref:Sialoadhesin n=1 Tax=Merluccius polli TaxID=89951 RepID=A0AA47MZI2_MERPO|nr:Sialoadhesin [Merluccius polli]
MKRYITILLLWCLLQGVGGQGWTVHLPQKVKGLEGSCVRIPCNFNVGYGWNNYLDSSCTAKWFRGQNLVQGQLVGNLLNKDCTTIFHNLTTSQSSLKYYFKLDCNILKYRFATGIDITVKAVWKPVLSRVGEAEVQEGSPVTLSCSTLITCPLLPPTLSWRPSLGEAQKEVGAKNVTTVLTFNASYIHHGERIFCSSLYKREAGHSDVSFENHLTINVLYPPRNVSVEWPSGPVLEGSYVRLNCSCSANPPVDSYTWYRSRLHPGPDQGPDQGPLGFNQSFTALVSEDTQFYCEVRNPYGVQNSSLTQMDVHYPPRNVSVEWPSGPVLEGSYVRLNCSCSANPPVDSYTWYRSRLHPGPDQGPDQGPLGFNQSFTALVSEDTQFYCEVRNPYGVQNSSLTQMDVHFPPKEVELRVEPPGAVLEGLAFTLSCSSRAQPPVSRYAWYRVSGGATGVRARFLDHGANFTVERAMRHHGGQYYCLAKNHLGEKESAPVHLDIHFAAEILSSSHCVRLQSGVRCFCESQGNPVPSLAWRLAGEAVNHSAHWPIMEFPIDHLGIISVISLNQSDEDPPTLVCLSNNSVGIDRMELNLAFSKAVHAGSLLIGWAAGSVVMTLLCALFHAQGEQVEVVYANKAALDEGGEELHYVDVSFVMLDAPLAAYPRLDFIRGLNSKTPEYAQIRPHPIGSGDGEPQEEDVYAECVSTGQTGVREVMVEGSQTDMKDSGIVP